MLTTDIETGVRCEEDYGIDGQTSILMNGVWNNPGKCFYRMVAVYGSLGLMGVGSGSTCAYVAWCLHEHASKGATPAKKNKKDNRMMAAVMKLVYFGGFVGTACFIAFVARLLPLVRPRPYAEVRKLLGVMVFSCVVRTAHNLQQPTSSGAMRDRRICLDCRPTHGFLRPRASCVSPHAEGVGQGVRKCVSVFDHLGGWRIKHRWCHGQLHYGGLCAS